MHEILLHRLSAGTPIVVQTYNSIPVYICTYINMYVCMYVHTYVRSENWKQPYVRTVCDNTMLTFHSVFVPFTYMKRFALYIYMRIYVYTYV